jgi:peptidoglycan/LPS O-acetylase OafA/YrhL
VFAIRPVRFEEKLPVPVPSLVFAAIKYNDQTAFPGTAAIIPVLGTSLLILSSQRWPPLLDKLGNNKVTQWLGEISYPPKDGYSEDY